MEKNKFHSLSYEKIITKFESSTQGLTTDVVTLRQKRDGLNVLKAKKKESVLLIILSQFKEPMTIILLIAAIFGFISEGLGWENGHKGVSIEGVVIIAILFINIVMTVLQEIKANNALNALQKMSAPTCRVIRDKIEVKIPASELVVGDIVYLDDGCIIPADLRLYNTFELQINESALTGESKVINKNGELVLPSNTLLADQKNMAFASTIVTNGKGFGIVCNIGQNTEIGKIAQLLDDTDEAEIPLKKKLNTICKFLTIIGGISCIFVIGITLIVDLNQWVKAIFLGISLAISVIPEGLPATATIILTLGVKKMAKEQALVKKISYIETLGAVNVICSDKTGTLTKNQMTIKNFYANHTLIKHEDYNKYLNILMCGVYCNNSYIDQNNKILGDPTEGSFILFANNNIKNWSDIRQKSEKVFELPFDSQRKMMTTIYKHHQQFTSYTKGSIEEILQHCSHIIKNEKIIAINDSDIKEILKIANECSENALRVLGLAIRSNIQKNEFKNSETNMTFLGFCSMYDPPRDEVRAVIEKCNNAGVRIIMITGDHPKTALAIATYLKIAQKGERVISGKELLTMNFDDLMVAVKDCHVFARVSPTDKINIVKALKANNDVVAMTGDGVNDAPSLKMADIGIAMGINGTDVAKDAANLILLDDNFTTIGKAVEEGRRIYTNLQKVIMFLVTGNISEIFIILLFSMMINWIKFVPLTAILILIINLVTDTIPCIFLGLDYAPNNIMKQPPIGKSDFLNKWRIIKIFVLGIITGFVCVGGYFIMYYLFNIKDNATLTAFIFGLLAISQIAIVLCYKSDSDSIFNRNNKIKLSIILSCIFSIFVSVSLIQIPYINAVFGLANLNIYHWLVIVALSLLPLIVTEVWKLCKNIKKN